MSGGRRQAVGATRRRNRHIAHKRYRNALQGRTAQRGAHCRIQDSGGGRVCGVLPTGAGVGVKTENDNVSFSGATHGRRAGAAERKTAHYTILQNRRICKIV